MAASFTVRVKNSNPFPIEDRFDGIVYNMPANGTAHIPSQAASHIFGVAFISPEGQVSINRDEIFKHLERRWGGNRTKREDGRNFRDIFDNLDFKLVAMKMVEQVMGEEDNGLEEAPSNAEPQPLRRRKTPRMPESEGGAESVEPQAEGSAA